MLVTTVGAAMPPTAAAMPPATIHAGAVIPCMMRAAAARAAFPAPYHDGAQYAVDHLGYAHHGNDALN